MLRVSLLLVALVLIVGMTTGNDAVESQSEETPEPEIPVVPGEELLTETFDTIDAWEQYSDLVSGIQLGVENGTYRAASTAPGFVWGLNAEEHTDVIIEVEITQLSIFPDSAFGVMCRADTSNNGDGYYFLINSNGFFSIRLGDGNTVFPLVDWGESDAIRESIDQNVVKAVCLEDYFAMYVNDELVAETTDPTFSSGYAGLAVAAVFGAGADVAFDNLKIHEAKLP